VDARIDRLAAEPPELRLALLRQVHKSDAAQFPLDPPNLGQANPQRSGPIVWIVLQGEVLAGEEGCAQSQLTPSLGDIRHHFVGETAFVCDGCGNAYRSLSAPAGVDHFYGSVLLGKKHCGYVHEHISFTEVVVNPRLHQQSSCRAGSDHQGGKILSRQGRTWSEIGG